MGRSPETVPLTGKNPPQGWRLNQGGADGGMWDNNKKRLRVVASVSTEQDGKRWLHMSMSHPKRIPTYDELVYMKRHWAGEQRKCIMVLPPSDEHVNFHPFCLHLFCCLDDDGLPDFTRGMGTI